jgi:hypothetical protein
MITIFMSSSPHNRRSEGYEVDKRQDPSLSAEEFEKFQKKRPSKKPLRPWSGQLLAAKLEALGNDRSWIQRHPSQKNSRSYIRNQWEMEGNGMSPISGRTQSDPRAETYKQPTEKLPDAEIPPRVPIRQDYSNLIPKRRTPELSQPLNTVSRTRHVAFETESSDHGATLPPAPPSPPATMRSETSESLPAIDVNPGIHAHGDAATAFGIEWSYLSKRRIGILSLRSRNHEMRVILRKKQDVYSEAADKFLQRVQMRELGIEPPRDPQESEHKTILDLLQECQDARDDYGPFEDECTRLENQLYREEFELHKIEEEFYRRWKIVPVLTDEALGSPEVLQQISSPTTDRDDQDDKFKFHPLVAEYLSKKGDLEMLREQLNDLEDERESLEDQSETQKRYGLSLVAEEQRWLDKSESEHQELLAQISQSEKYLEALQDECFQMKLVDEEGEPTEWRNIGEDGMESGSQISEYVKFSILLPGMDLEGVQVHKSDLEDKSRTTAGYINRWILGMLQCSAVDANNLARFSEGEGGWYGEPWQEAVLKLWFDDETSKIKDFRGYTASLTTQAHHHQQVESQLSPELSENGQYQSHHRRVASSEVVCQSEDTETTEIAENLASMDISPSH